MYSSPDVAATTLAHIDTPFVILTLVAVNPWCFFSRIVGGSSESHCLWKTRTGGERTWNLSGAVLCWSRSSVVAMSPRSVFVRSLFVLLMVTTLLHSSVYSRVDHRCQRFCTWFDDHAQAGCTHCMQLWSCGRCVTCVSFQDGFGKVYGFETRVCCAEGGHGHRM